jgi:hypothetical protein
MIIKTTRVRTRGAALKKLLEHLENVDDNEQVVVLRGNAADLSDARSDSRAFGREYCLRQWIVSPKGAASDERLLESVDRLGAEFGFDPAKAFVVRHTKAKVDTALFDRHIHILVAETDPITGGALSSSHNWLRGEKVAKIVSFDWNEFFVESTKPKAILAALKRDGRDDVAAAYRQAFPEQGPRPVASFDCAAAQRLKRKGLDLPALRALVADAWASAADRSEFELNLSECGLIARPGDKPGVVVIATVAGENVGSLARLAKITKAAVEAKMEKQDAGPEKWDEDATADAVEADLGGSGLQEYEADQRGLGTAEAAGGAGAGHASGRANRDVDRGEPAVGRSRPADVGEIGPDHRIAGGTVDRESPPGYGEGLIASNDFALTFGLAAHIPALTGILRLATRNAMSQDERVAFELGEIEEEARVARAMIDTRPPEPASLIKARDAMSEAQRKVATAQSVVDGAVEVSTALRRPRPWWQRAIGLITGENAQHASRMRAAALAERKAQSALSRAENNRRSEDNRLALALQQHKKSVKEHIEKWTEHAKTAEAKAVVTARVREILQLLPGAAAFGVAGLHRLGSKFPKQPRSGHDGPHPDGEATFSVLF